MTAIAGAGCRRRNAATTIHQLWLAQAMQCQRCMTIVSTFPLARARRLRQTIAALRRRISGERELLWYPRLELAAARQMVRSQRRLEVLRRQLR